VKTNNFRRIATTSSTKTRYLDQATYHTHSYKYYIVAIDHAHNRSSRSNIVKISL
jgi:hypothetical protein